MNGGRTTRERDLGFLRFGQKPHTELTSGDGWANDGRGSDICGQGQWVCRAQLTSSDQWANYGRGSDICGQGQAHSQSNDSLVFFGFFRIKLWTYGKSGGATFRERQKRVFTSAIRSPRRMCWSNCTGRARSRASRRARRCRLSSSWYSPSRCTASDAADSPDSDGGRGGYGTGVGGY